MRRPGSARLGPCPHTAWHGPPWPRTEARKLCLSSDIARLSPSSHTIRGGVRGRRAGRLRPAKHGRAAGKGPPRLVREGAGKVPCAFFFPAPGQGLMFHGSMVALVTPMNEDGSLDVPALRRLVDFHVENGTEAIVAVGTTGVSPTLDMEEHCEVIRLTVEHARGRLPVIAGTGANS